MKLPYYDTVKPPYDNLDIFFPYDWYDGPLYGLCWYHHDLSYFVIGDDDGEVYHVFKLNVWQKINHLCQKWMFEFFVGDHWSDKNIFNIRKPKIIQDWLMKVYYKYKLNKWGLRHDELFEFGREQNGE